MPKLHQSRQEDYLTRLMNAHGTQNIGKTESAIFVHFRNQNIARYITHTGETDGAGGRD